MRVDKKHLAKAIESIIYNGVINSEEIDLTTNSVLKVIEPLILIAETLKSTNDLLLLETVMRCNLMFPVTEQQDIWFEEKHSMKTESGKDFFERMMIAVSKINEAIL